MKKLVENYSDKRIIDLLNENGEKRDFFLISSFGGCGTTFLINFVSNYKKTNDSSDKDGLKHIKSPPDLSFIKKALYLFSDPKNAVVYHFSKINQGFPFWPINHCRNMGGDWAKMKVNWNLRDYLNNKEDLFKIEVNFNNWLSSKENKYNI